jgi:hypothetical protein
MWLEEELREAMASSNDAIVCDRAKLTCFLLQKAANLDTLLVKSSTHSRRSARDPDRFI